MGQGGFAVFSGLIDAHLMQRLLAEAVCLSSTAVESRMDVSDGEENRGGAPARCYLNSPGGPVQHAMYRTPATLAFLRGLTAPSLEPTGEVGTYSYYARAGDFLALHRDIVTCDVAVITCLSDRPATATGGELVLYPDRCQETLSSIRSRPSEGAYRIRLREGHTLVFYGGIVPHELLPVSAGQARIVSVLCYRVGPPAFTTDRTCSHC
jgi:2OG-Fe(II) oxygenase superfamily